MTVRQRRPNPLSNIIILGQYLAIIGLLTAISSEYFSNSYMQQWISQNASPLGYLLNGFLGPILLAILGIGYLAWRRFFRRGP